MRVILDEWKNITGLDRKTDERCGSAIPRPGTPSTAGGGPTSPSWIGTIRDPAGEGTAVRAGRRAVRLDGLDGHQRGIPEAAHRVESGGRASKELDDALWHRFKAAQDVFFKARNASRRKRHGAER